jgi:hypothetical protein
MKILLPRAAWALYPIIEAFARAPVMMPVRRRGGGESANYSDILQEDGIGNASIIGERMPGCAGGERNGNGEGRSVFAE